MHSFKTSLTFDLLINPLGSFDNWWTVRVTSRGLLVDKHVEVLSEILDSARSVLGDIPVVPASNTFPQKFTNGQNIFNDVEKQTVLSICVFKVAPVFGFLCHCRCLSGAGFFCGRGNDPLGICSCKPFARSCSSINVCCNSACIRCGCWPAPFCVTVGICDQEGAHELAW